MELALVRFAQNTLIMRASTSCALFFILAATPAAADQSSASNANLPDAPAPAEQASQEVSPQVVAAAKKSPAKKPYDLTVEGMDPIGHAKIFGAVESETLKMTDFDIQWPLEKTHLFGFMRPRIPGARGYWGIGIIPGMWGSEPKYATLYGTPVGTARTGLYGAGLTLMNYQMRFLDRKRVSPYLGIKANTAGFDKKLYSPQYGTYYAVGFNASGGIATRITSHYDLTSFFAIQHWSNADFDGVSHDQGGGLLQAGFGLRWHSGGTGEQRTTTNTNSVFSGTP